MWNAYSTSYIKNNKTSNRFIIIISFLSSMFLSFISCLFYNLWLDQVKQNVNITGSSQIEFTPVIIASIIVFAIASFSLIMMIHHAFAATMTNRIHQLGILESVGATPKQIKRTLVNEVIVLSLPAIIVGNIIGIGLCWIFMEIIIRATAGLRDYTLIFSYNLLVLLGSVFFSTLTVLISAWIPSRKISRIEPLEAINYGNEPVIKRVKRFRLRSSLLGIYSELARKSLFVRRKSMRIGTISIFLAVFACISLLNILGISNLSTQKTYFDRFENNWDYIITSKENDYSNDLLNDIRNTDNVKNCIVYQNALTNTLIPKEYLSDEVQKIGLEKLNSNFTKDNNNSYNTKVHVLILDDISFKEYSGNDESNGAIVVNIIWDSIKSKRTDRQYIPFLNKNNDIKLNINNHEIRISNYKQSLPILREELKQYSLTLVMSESYYNSLYLNLNKDNPKFTIKLDNSDKYDVAESNIKKLMDFYTNYEFEGRIEERENELKVQSGLRMIIYLFTGLLTCIGLANIFASTLGQIHQRKREFARYFSIGLTPKEATKILAWEAIIVAFSPIILTIIINIPLLAIMLNAGGISAQEFIAERLPLIPAIIIFATVIGFVALAYYLGGKKIYNMNLIETIKDDSLSM